MLVKKMIAVAVLSLATAGSALAEVVDFNEVTTSFQGSASFNSGSLTFTGTATDHGVWVTSPDIGAYNGTPYLLDGYGSQLSMMRIDAGVFTLNSFEMALGWYTSALTSVEIGVTYDLAGGGTQTDMLSLDHNFNLFSPGLDITGATFDLSSLTDYGYISLDNIDVDGSTVPEPGTMMLMGVSLLGLGFVRRRKVL